MNSRERVRSAIDHTSPDRIPAAFEAVESVVEKLLKHYQYSQIAQLYDRYRIDIAPITPTYTGPPLKSYTDAKGNLVKKNFWGFESTFYENGIERYEITEITSFYPLNGVETPADIDHYEWPNPDWFDYKSVEDQITQYPDKAIITGHEGPFQIATSLMNMEHLFMLMLDKPELVHRFLDRMVMFELEYYERLLIAGKGRIDILRPHDDYGTQISLLFSIDMWREFFKENTKRLVDLAHHYGAYYQQHSCGAIRPLISEFVECGVDVLEPLQKVQGLDPQSLQDEFGGKITFHGGIDTQSLLPFGTPQQVNDEVQLYKRCLNKDGGYILMASQAFESDVPIENIEAVYCSDR